MAKLDPQDHRETLDPMANQASPDHQDSQALPDRRPLRASPARRDPRDQLAHPGSPASLVLHLRLVFQAHKDPPVHPASPERPEATETQDRLAAQALLAQMLSIALARLAPAKCRAKGRQPAAADQRLAVTASALSRPNASRGRKNGVWIRKGEAQAS